MHRDIVIILGGLVLQHGWVGVAVFLLDRRGVHMRRELSPGCIWTSSTGRGYASGPYSLLIGGVGHIGGHTSIWEVSEERSGLCLLDVMGRVRVVEVVRVVEAVRIVRVVKVVRVARMGHRSSLVRNRAVMLE